MSQATMAPRPKLNKLGNWERRDGGRDCPIPGTGPFSGTVRVGSKFPGIRAFTVPELYTVRVI